MGADTEVRASCSLTVQGQMYFFGGETQKRQISMLDDCQVKRVGDLAFDFYLGGCGYFQSKIHLCFGSESDKCYTLNEDLSNSGDFTTTNHPHDSVPVAVGDGKSQVISEILLFSFNVCRRLCKLF